MSTYLLLSTSLDAHRKTTVIVQQLNDDESLTKRPDLLSQQRVGNGWESSFVCSQRDKTKEREKYWTMRKENLPWFRAFPCHPKVCGGTSELRSSFIVLWLSVILGQRWLHASCAKWLICYLNSLSIKPWIRQTINWNQDESNQSENTFV